MSSIAITESNFREIYQNNDIVVLDFWAIWCGPCHQFSPIFESVSEQISEVIFGKVDSESELKLSSYFSVRSIPTIIIIREGLELFRHSGVMSEDQLVSIIQKIKAADMDEVKRKIEEEESQ